MPFTPQIRNYILKALEEKILPSLQKATLTQVVVQPPFDFEDIEHWHHKRQLLDDQKPQPLQMAWYWPKEKMAAGKFPFIGFIFEGTLDHRIGITNSLANESKRLSGKKLGGAITVRVPAPAFIHFAPGIPGQNGSEPFIDPAHPGGGPSKIIWASVMDQEVRIHYCESSYEDIFSSHSLQIHDPWIINLLHLYIEESRQEPHNKHAQQSLLLVIVNRIYRQLKFENAPLANSAWPLPSIHTSTLPNSKKEYELCQSAMDFVEKHLHDKLSRAEIAQALDISADHLGRVFLQVSGMSIMRYVTNRRIEAAKLVLANGKENINEITQLTGFASAASFCAAFKRATGISPLDYRRLLEKRLSSNRRSL